MKASVFDEYGEPDVLHIEEVATPVPKDREVRIRVHATSVNYGDLLVRNFAAVRPRTFNMPALFWLIGKLTFGVWKPRTRILGSELAGEIDAVGRRVTRFRVGDRVFGYVGPRMGAYAEQLCMPETGVLAPMPANLTFEEAASVPYGAVIALGILRRARLTPGQSLLVIGASGGTGAALVQLASRYVGARVTAVCGPSRLEYARSLGASTVLDYSTGDYLAHGETYDVIIDVLGKSSFARCRSVLAPDGRLVFVSFKARQIAQMVRTAVVGRQKVICPVVGEKAEDLRLIKDLIEAGTFRPAVDKTFSLDHAPDAHRYAASRARAGSVVIAIP